MVRYADSRGPLICTSVRPRSIMLFGPEVNDTPSAVRWIDGFSAP